MSTSYTGQNLLDSIRLMPLLAPVFNSQVAGFSMEPMLSILNDANGYWYGESYPWKYNEILPPPFYINSYQQDYAGNGITNLGWLTSGDVLDVNNTALPKAQPQVEVVRNLPRSATWVALPPMFFGTLKFQVCWLYNQELYYGTWGAANTGNATRGNNPQASQVITNPLASGKAMPTNPILQIKDANGNLLVLTTFGTTGISAPSAAANASPGTTVTDGSCVWTVVDPLGAGFRIWPPPAQSGVVWQFNLRGQAKAPSPLTSLTTLLSPLPNEYFHLFREGCIAMAYGYSAEEKVRNMREDALAVWTEKLVRATKQADKEPGSEAFIPSGGIVAPPTGQMPVTPGNPFGTWGGV